MSHKVSTESNSEYLFKNLIKMFSCDVDEVKRDPFPLCDETSLISQATLVLLLLRLLRVA